jgi:hypothetical protein
MAPSTASQSSPPQEAAVLPKRSLRNRSANATVAANSSRIDGMGGDSDKDGGGKRYDLDGAGQSGDARGKFPLSLFPIPFASEKSKLPLRLICRPRRQKFAKTLTRAATSDEIFDG